MNVAVGILFLVLSFVLFVMGGVFGLADGHWAQGSFYLLLGFEAERISDQRLDAA